MIPNKEEWRLALEARHTPSAQRKFSEATVAVCGLGGLGSNIAITLARAGVGKLILIDFDKVDITNLHRQQYKVCQLGRFKTEALYENLKEIAPYLNAEIHTEKLMEENALSFIEKADVICEAFDNAVAKAMLVNLVLEKTPDKYIVAASGMAGLKSPNSIKTRKITDRFYLCGDEVSDVKDTIGLVAPQVMLCAAHQAQTVLRIIAGEFEA